MSAFPYGVILYALCITTSFLNAQPAATQPALDTVSVQIKNEEAINTSGLEFSPTFFEDGIVFISTNTVGLKKDIDPTLNLPAMSILRSKRKPEGQLGEPEPFARELTSVNHEGPVCFDRTGETVFFSSNLREEPSKNRPASKELTRHMRLYMAEKKGASWAPPKPLPFNKGDFDDCHPAISIDGDKLFFASNRPGGFGGMDIYVSYRVGDTWSEPVNLGPSVNSRNHEVFPFIHADNTLYYASNGLPNGKGGFDLYYTTPEGSQWTKPVNLGAPFNTKDDDFGLIVDLNKINGYFSTNGNTGKGGDEIFSFHTENGNLDDYLLQNRAVPDRELDVTIIALDKTSNSPLSGATVQLIEESLTNAIGRDQSGNFIGLEKVNGNDVMRSLTPDQGVNGQTNGRGLFTSPIRAGNYIAIVSKKGYQTKQLRLPISKPNNEITLSLEKIGPVAGKVQWNASVLNYATNAPMGGATLVMTNLATGARDTIVTDANGNTDYYLKRNSKYKMDVYQGKRLVGTSQVTTSNNAVMTQDIAVAPLLPGAQIELPNIYYNFNDATLRPDAYKDLDVVVALLQQHAGITLELASHTDSRGSNSYNQNLSQRRADGVVDYLVSRGVPRQRLKPVGYGESKPRNSCVDGVACEESEHARNRRTEMRVVTGMQGASVVYIDGEVAQSSAAIQADEMSVEPLATGKPAKPGKNNPPAKPTKSEPTPENTGVVSITNSNTGKTEYHVVAGSFLMETRAHNQAATVKEAGYTDVQVVQFPNSPFYSVSVGRFDKRTPAQELERKLESANIEAFVRAVPQ